MGILSLVLSVSSLTIRQSFLTRLSFADPSVVMEAAKSLEYITLGSGGIMDELEAETARALVKVLYSRGAEMRSNSFSNTKAAAAAVFGTGKCLSIKGCHSSRLSSSSLGLFNAVASNLSPCPQTSRPALKPLALPSNHAR